MKTISAGLALISGLMAVVTADALPPEDIPLQCVPICGPIVELTTDCDVHWRLKKRNPDGLARREWTPKLAVEPQVGGPFQPTAGVRSTEVVDRFGRRSFSIIVAAPTSFPVEAAATTDSDLDLRPESTLTRITPTIEKASFRTTLAVSTRSTSTTTTTITSLITSITIPPVSNSMSDEAAESSTTSSWNWDDDIQEPKGQLYTQGNAEKDCVCLNESFDVAKITALCASCIAQAGFPDNNINVIMEGCNFTALTYTPSQDSAANNINVKAVRPSSVASSNAALNARPASFGLAAAALGFVFVLL
ncbi:hypothetical protein BGZ61DRAFT_494410 [Ilyonectria robusta]|uniref:uncharacterized protein n=1 Tax=Ilyonectria robusta TaxID=1079257 RepID=UPI001E8D3298|nr:uncharacterized protein BGZ61DRAFT_494410 [Ilyonectria robusta]KAH8688287.1 hypothetical protein BGZ61DRAFT_494410 [Ilyonectria robusta]